MSPEDLESLIAVFARGLEGLDDPNDRAEVQDAIEDLRTDLSAEAVEPERIQRRLRVLKRVADRVGNTALTAATNEGTQRLIDLLGNLN